MQFKPLNDLVLIKPDQSADRVGSILLPESAQTKSTTGTVVAVGHGKCTDSGTFVPTTVKLGDKVMYTKFSVTTELVIEDVTHLVIPEGSIVGIIEG